MIVDFDSDVDSGDSVEISDDDKIKKKTKEMDLDDNDGLKDYYDDFIFDDIDFDKTIQNNNNNCNDEEKKEEFKHKNNEINKRFIPPLYFQHQGHSRTIIGIVYNRKSKLRHLLVLDPSVKNGGVGLLNNIKKGNIGQLMRSLKQIPANKYQIVCVPAYGVMGEDDRQRCKTIQSRLVMNKK